MSTNALDTPVQFRATSVSVHFGGLKAVDDVSLSVRRGAMTAIIGPNGAGKSTFLNAVTGFLPQTTGQVEYEGLRMDHLPPWKRVRLGMARTFQDLEVFPQLTVAENVAVGLPVGILHKGETSADRRSAIAGRSRRDLVMSHLEEVGLSMQADRLAAELSYGEQKMLVVARLMATQAELLIFDEPGAGLARGTIDELGKLLKDLSRRGRTVLLVDHNMDLILQYADYVYVLHHGVLLAEGEPQEIKANKDVMNVYLGGDLGGSE